MSEQGGSGLKVLVVDDEEVQRQAIAACVDEEHQVLLAADSEEALNYVEAEMVDLALVDLRLGGESGLELIPQLIGRSPWLKVVVLTAHATVDTAVQAMRAGASDYLMKPVAPQSVRILMERIAATRRVERQAKGGSEADDDSNPSPIRQSRDPVMQRMFDLAARVAPSGALILIRGESGTGKGVIAREIHRLSPRAGETFAVVNCPALSGELLQSELFGHVKGAFTGAVKSKMGKVELASKGTLFLDEIGDLPLVIQPKLLRFVQERKYERVGDPKAREANVRIISATNRELEAMVKDGSFREDLLYRLNVIEMTMPPLRERPSDVEDLAISFLAYFSKKYGKRIEDFSESAWEHIRSHSWPGNVRELQNAIERAAILNASPTVSREDLPFKG